MRDEHERPGLRIVASAPSDGQPAAIFTIKDVADACGLPQPVIAQLVSRTWTEDGWMYTRAQLQSATAIAAALRGDAFH